jgi:hypothetical protein
MSRDRRTDCDVQGCNNEHVHRTEDQEGNTHVYCPWCFPFYHSSDERVVWSA